MLKEAHQGIFLDEKKRQEKTPSQVNIDISLKTKVSALSES